ncbi:MAG TPA: DUF5317 domain-containing protein [Clostridia bacterium]|nr:DUF5317 domain-containing protein [Clostridia bacterium]
MVAEGVLLGIITGLIARRKISNLMRIRLSWIWLGVVLAIIYLGIAYFMPTAIWQDYDYGLVFFGAFYFLLFVFLWKNKHLPGMLLFTAGFLLSFLVGIINIASIPVEIPWLTKVIQKPWSGGGTFSIANFLISLGVFWLVFRTMTKPDHTTKLTSVRCMRL